MGERTLVWLDSALVAELTMVNEVVEMKEGEMLRLITKFKDDIELMDEIVDENVVQFRYYAQKVRNSYRKVVEEEIQATYDLWEELDKQRSEAKRKLESAQTVSSDLLKDVQRIHDALDDINIYGVDKYLELVDKVVNMPEADRKLMKQLLDLQDRRPGLHPC